MWVGVFFFWTQCMCNKFIELEQHYQQISYLLLWCAKWKDFLKTKMTVSNTEQHADDYDDGVSKSDHSCEITQLVWADSRDPGSKWNMKERRNRPSASGLLSAAHVPANLTKNWAESALERFHQLLAPEPTRAERTIC